MSKAIAIFDNQANAVNAIQGLRDEGFAPEEIQVYGRDRDTIRFVEADTDVHADELQDILETRGADADVAPPGGPGFVVGAAPLGGSTISSGGATFFSGGYSLVGDMFSNETPFERVFIDMGLTEAAAEKCRDAVKEGGIVVIVDREDGSDGIYKADGPTSEWGASAERIFRFNSASTVL